MKKSLSFICALVCFSSLYASEQAALLFEDHFERKESQKKTDEVGNGWGTNSKARAGGNKQVDLRNGAMYIYRHADADHAVSVTHSAVFRDGSVELLFMLEEAKDSLGVDFADLECKEVHAGHLFKVDVSPKQLDITDAKTGHMNLALIKLREENQLTPEQKKFIASKKKSVPIKLEVGKWHTLHIAVAGDKVTASIDGKVLNTFSSEGFAHPTKRLIRLAVPRNAVVDDVKAMRFTSAP